MKKLEVKNLEILQGGSVEGDCGFGVGGIFGGASIALLALGPIGVGIGVGIAVVGIIVSAENCGELAGLTSN